MAVFSVNTNPGAFVALQSLTATTNALTTTQNRVSTGLEIAGVEDDGAGFIIAQNIRSDIGGLNAINESLDRAAGALDVAISAGETISNLLIEAREIALAASDTGLDAASRTALEDDFVALQEQITSIVASADFNGTNIISSSPDTISAIIDLAGGVSGSTITVTGVNLNLDGTTLSLSTLTFGTAANAQSALNQITAAVSSLNSVLGGFGAAANQIELQQEFSSNLQDTLEVGVGNIVDADLAVESANLQALQVQQQLGLTALGIANAAPSAILSLF